MASHMISAKEPDVAIVPIAGKMHPLYYQETHINMIV